MWLSRRSVALELRQRGALAAQICSSGVSQGASRRPAANGGSSNARCVLPYRPGFAAQKHVNVLEPEWTWTLGVVDGVITEPYHLLLLPRKRERLEELTRVLPEPPYLYVAHYAAVTPAMYLLSMQDFVAHPSAAAILKVGRL